MASRLARRAIAEAKQRWSSDGWLKTYFLELLRASEGTLSMSRLHFKVKVNIVYSV
jgi:hypothetical protein